MQLEIFVNSDVGRVRRGNEDNFLLLNLDSERFEIGGQTHVASGFQNIELRDEGLVLAVADGMGGALAGEVASLKAVETVRDILLGNDMEITLAPDAQHSLIERLNRATIHANTSIYLQGRSDAQFNGMGSTFTAASLTKDAVDFLQVGDSRAYVIRGEQIEQVTKDQSLVQQLIDSGQISDEEAETHSLRNVILQALGAQSDVVPIAVRYKPLQNDILLLCSDGLSNKLAKQDLFEIVTKFSGDLKQACIELVSEANKRGGEDNITVILARLTGENLAGEPETISVEKLMLDGSDEFPTQIP
ncbi:MAG: serine/threonine-protein phosphatase [Pyrinomonadaceae bacterium]|nr:serine/threonine-protein phosphatase [Pyrinomonadaceae bacterium]